MTSTTALETLPEVTTDARSRALSRGKAFQDLSTLTEGGKTIPVGALTTQFMYASDRIKGQQYKSEFSSDRPSSLLEHVVHFSFAMVVGVITAVAGSVFHYSEKYLDNFNVTQLFGLTRDFFTEKIANDDLALALCLHQVLTAILSALVVGYVVTNLVPEW
jgi:hypothetical protein